MVDNTEDISVQYNHEQIGIIRTIPEQDDRPILYYDETPPGEVFKERVSRDLVFSTHVKKALVLARKANPEAAFIVLDSWLENFPADSLASENDPVNHPKHYTSHPSGVECIEITRHMGFNLGNVVKYIWRDGLKDCDVPLQDLKKALWYLQDEIKMREKD